MLSAFGHAARLMNPCNAMQWVPCRAGLYGGFVAVGHARAPVIPHAAVLPVAAAPPGVPPLLLAAHAATGLLDAAGGGSAHVQRVRRAVQQQQHAGAAEAEAAEHARADGQAGGGSAERSAAGAAMGAMMDAQHMHAAGAVRANASSSSSRSEGRTSSDAFVPPGATTAAPAPAASLPAVALALHAALYVCVALMNLTLSSALWGLAATTFGPHASKRLFGFFAAGATFGQLAASTAAMAFIRLHHRAPGERLAWHSWLADYYMA